MIRWRKGLAQRHRKHCGRYAVPGHVDHVESHVFFVQPEVAENISGDKRGGEKNRIKVDAADDGGSCRHETGLDFRPSFEVSFDHRVGLAEFCVVVPEFPIALFQILLKPDDPFRCLQTRFKLCGIDRFRDEIVGTGGHPFEHRVGLVRCSHQADVDIVFEVFGPDFSTQLQSVHHGHPPVGEKEVDPFLLQDPPCLAAVRGAEDLVAHLAQSVHQQETRDVVVVRHETMYCHVGHEIVSANN